MEKKKKLFWIFLILVLSAATWFLVDGLEKEMQAIDVVTDEGLLSGDVYAGLLDNVEWNYDDRGSIFMEYRLQRDRVRDQEIEMLEAMIENPEISQKSKEEAESMLLELIQLMEHELLIENMVKAQGFEDAIFFYRKRVATVMVKKKDLSEAEFLQIADTVTGVMEIPREDVQVISGP